MNIHGFSLSLLINTILDNLFSMKKFFSFFIGIIVASLSCFSAEQLYADFHIIPIPKSIEIKKGNPFVLDGETRIIYAADADSAMIRNAAFLRDFVKQATGLSLNISDEKAKKNAIVLKLDNRIAAPEGYEIDVTDKLVKISASTDAGIFYGIQTLRKALPYGKTSNEIKIPAVIVKDSPRMSYRGMLLDCGRHFFPVEDIKTFIDMLALHNMNVFHWHLTEDQGWRFEVKKYPQLTKKGSVRRGTEIGWSVGLNDSIPYGGYYTQDDCREIVKYASERNITVIPEIDMPGHTQSLLACFPEAGCTGGPYSVSDHWGVHEDILCAGNDKTYEIMEDILDEVCDVFPSQYINIGGDEAPKTRWEKCPKCQDRIKKENIKSTPERSAESALQGYFTRRIEKYLNDKGRKVIGWNEILESGADTTSAIMNRYGEAATKEAVRAGHDVIVNTTEYSYFDYPQREDLRLEPKLFPLGRCVPVSKVYQLEPVPAGLTAEEESHIIGVQANVWGEFINMLRLAQYQMLPRMAATCETQWIAPELKVYHDFLRRLPKLTKVYDVNGYFWCKGIE